MRGLSAAEGERMSDEDCDAIAEFIRSKGITRCPTACVSPTQALVGAADRVALEEHAATRDRLFRARAATNWGKLLHPKPCDNSRSVPVLRPRSDDVSDGSVDTVPASQSGKSGMRGIRTKRIGPA